MWKSRKRKRLCNLLNWNWNEKLLVGQDYRAEILTLWFSIFKRTVFSWINVYVPRQFDYGLNDSRCEHFLLFIDREIFLINGWQVKHESWSILQIAEHFINSSSIFFQLESPLEPIKSFPTASHTYSFPYYAKNPQYRTLWQESFTFLNSSLFFLFRTAFYYSIQGIVRGV